MKKLFTIFLVFMGVSGYSQLYVPSGETIFTTSTDELTSKENVTNNGTIYSVEMNKTTAQTLSGTGTLRYLKANNSADISLSSAHTVTNDGITLTAGKLIIGNYNVTTASVSNDSATRYIKTNGTGVLRMNATTGGYTKYPIGNSSLNYLRVYNNNASADTFAVRVQDTLYANAGTSAGSINNAVNRTWYLTKTASNSGSGVNLEFNWNSGDVNGTISNATLNEYNGTKWVKSSGTQSVSGNQLTITGYTDTLGNKQFMVASALDASVSVAATACLNATGVTATFTGSNGTAPYTFTYTINGGTNQSVTTTSGNSVTVDVNTAAAGNIVYDLVSVEDGNQQNSVSGSDTISIAATSSSTETVTACDSYAWHGTTYTSSNNTATWTGTNAAGCDSVVTLNLTINSATTSTETATACDSYVWHGTTYTSSNNTATWTGTNAAGCDSVVTLNLTITSSSSNSTTASACDSYTWSVNGTTYTQSGTYTSVSGCVTEILNLTITASSSNSTTASACDSYTWSVNGTTYTQSGTYTSVSGCATEILNLTITASSSNSTTASACDSYTWSVNGTTYTQSGTYTSVSGCATETLNLTINSATSSTETVSACVSYAWHGTTYTSSNNSATWTTTNAAGCDSVVTLNLTISALPSAATASVTQPTALVATGSIIITAPTGAGYTYSIGGAYQSAATFSGVAAGTYAISVKNAAGCTSATTTSVTVNPYSGVIPSMPDSVYGIVNVCPYVGTPVELEYRVNNVNGAISYTWTAPANTQIMSGQGTNTIRLKVLTGFATVSNKQLRVKANSSVGSSTQKILYLRMDPPMTPVAIIASSNDVCPSIGNNTAITYRVRKVAAATSYIWAAQNGTTTVTSVNGSGENDTLVNVTFSSNFSSSNITVRAVNDCGVSIARSLPINRNNPTIGLISGPANACEYMANGTPATYSVAAVAGASAYNWTLPSGVTNVTGQGTNSISFVYPNNFVSGSISVYSSNGCGVSQTRTINVSRLLPFAPGIPDVINVSACPNRSYSYTLAGMPLQTNSIVWTVPQGATIVSGQGTISMVVSYPNAAISGQITIKGVNGCGVSSVREIPVKLPACQVLGLTTNKTVNPATTAMEGMKVNVYPNPSVSSFSLKILTADSQELSVRILDVQGRSIKSLTILPHQTINIGNELKSGVYMVEVKQGNETKTTRVVKY